MEATVPKPRAHINLADLEFAAGNHLMSKKTFKLPEGTHKILKPGGYWINLGPLLYHWQVAKSGVGEA